VIDESSPKAWRNYPDKLNYVHRSADAFLSSMHDQWKRWNIKSPMGYRACVLPGIILCMLSKELGLCETR